MKLSRYWAAHRWLKRSVINQCSSTFVFFDMLPLQSSGRASRCYFQLLGTDYLLLKSGAHFIGSQLLYYNYLPNNMFVKPNKERTCWFSF